MTSPRPVPTAVAGRLGIFGDLVGDGVHRVRLRRLQPPRSWVAHRLADADPAAPGRRGDGVVDRAAQPAGPRPAGRVQTSALPSEHPRQPLPENWPSIEPGSVHSLMSRRRDRHGLGSHSPARRSASRRSARLWLAPLRQAIRSTVRSWRPRGRCQPGPANHVRVGLETRRGRPSR